MKKAEQKQIIELIESINLTHLRDLHKKVAQSLQAKMESAGLSKVMDGKYFIQSMQSQTHGDCSYLAMNADDYYGTVVDLTAKTSSTRDSSYLFGDFSLCYNSPALEDAREFMADVSEIYEELKTAAKAT